MLEIVSHEMKLGNFFLKSWF